MEQGPENISDYDAKFVVFSSKNQTYQTPGPTDHLRGVIVVSFSFRESVEDTLELLVETA